MIQYITLEEVKAACRLAYAEDRLLAQDAEGTYYGYQITDKKGKVRVCAIGAALTSKTQKFIHDSIMESEVIPYAKDIQNPSIQDAFTWDEVDQDALHDIQNAHDKWMQASLAYGGGNGDEELFCTLVGITD